MHNLKGFSDGNNNTDDPVNHVMGKGDGGWATAGCQDWGRNHWVVEFL